MNSASPLPRVALYARVSSAGRVAAGAIASQLDSLQQRIKQDGFTCDDFNCFIDDGYSGETLLRPALERLRDQAALAAFDRLYIHNPDRLSRKYVYQVILLEELARAGVEVVFLNRPCGNTPEDALLVQVQGIIAEYERTKILERGRRGRLHAARAGRVSVLSTAPYGYHYVDKHAGGGVARFEIILEQARVVRQIFAWVGQESLSLREVCRRLRQQGVTSPRGKPLWSANTVSGLLSNPAYKGEAGYGKTQRGEQRPRLRPARGQAEQPRRVGSIYLTPEKSIAIPVPALVSGELFATVAEQLRDNQKRQRQRQSGGRYLLAGLLVCKLCGYAYHGMAPGGVARTGKRHAYYRCGGGNASRHGGERICKNLAVRGDLLEEAVWQDVCGLLNNPTLVEAEYQRRVKQDKHDTKGSRATQQRCAMLEKSIQRLIDAYTEGLVEKEEFASRIKGMREKVSVLQQQERQEQDEERLQASLRLFISGVEEFARHVQGGLADAEWQVKRKVCERMIKQIEIDDGGVNVIYRVGLPPFEGGPAGGFSSHCNVRAYAAPLA
jgi:site-specific DNA recombinase